MRLKNGKPYIKINISESFMLTPKPNPDKNRWVGKPRHKSIISSKLRLFEPSTTAACFLGGGVGAGGVLAIKGVGVSCAAKSGGGVKVILDNGRGVWLGVIVPVRGGRVGDGDRVLDGSAVGVSVEVMALEVTYLR